MLARRAAGDLAQAVDRLKERCKDLEVFPRPYAPAKLIQEMKHVLSSRVVDVTLRQQSRSWLTPGRLTAGFQLSSESLLVRAGTTGRNCCCRRSIKRWSSRREVRRSSPI